jgi:hypothetical protein
MTAAFGASPKQLGQAAAVAARKRTGDLSRLAHLRSGKDERRREEQHWRRNVPGTRSRVLQSRRSGAPDPSGKSWNDPRASEQRRVASGEKAAGAGDQRTTGLPFETTLGGHPLRLCSNRLIPYTGVAPKPKRLLHMIAGQIVGFCDLEQVPE